MIIQNRDGSIVEENRHPEGARHKQQSYCAEVPVSLLDEESSLIDRIISFAFDTLGARQLKLRVRDAE